MSDDGAHGTDLAGGPEVPPQEAVGVQVLDPLAVLQVGLAAGEVLAAVFIGQADLDACGFKDLEEGDPENAGGLHCHGGDLASPEPVVEGVEVFGEGGEGAHGVRPLKSQVRRCRCRRRGGRGWAAPERLRPPGAWFCIAVAWDGLGWR